MNQLAPAKRSELRRLLLAGVPMRASARAVGCAHMTAVRYARLWLIQSACPCGKEGTHRGWCAWRMQFSPQRRSWLDEKGWARNPAVNIAALVDAATKQATTKGHRLGPFVWTEGASASDAHGRCRVCGGRVRIVGDRIEGRALSEPCITDADRAREQQRRQEKRQWDEAKRTVKQLRKILRDPSHSQSVASTPAPTSRRSCRRS